jgi:hypothetical protein
MSASTILRTATSSVVPLKSGGFLEVRRGNLRGSQLHDKRHWATQEEWLAAVGEPLRLQEGPVLTPDQEFVKSHGELTGSMTKYNAYRDMKHIGTYGPYASRMPSLQSRIEMLSQLITSSVTNDYYYTMVNPRFRSRLYVLDEEGTMHPIYMQPRKTLLGIPEGTFKTGNNRTILKSGRSFEELGIRPRSYWKMDGFGQLKQL